MRRRLTPCFYLERHKRAKPPRFSPTKTMDHFAIVAPNGLATAQFVGLPAVCCLFAAFAQWKLPKTTPLHLIKAVCVIGALLQLRVYYYAMNSEVQFVDDRMQFKVPGYYDRSINLRDIAFADLRIVNLAETPGLQLKQRTDGIGLMDYHLGWHRLNNGQNAWVAITGRPGSAHRTHQQPNRHERVIRR
jgi:hypothetical protein